MVDDSPADCRLCKELIIEVYGSDLEFFESHGAARGLKTCRSVAVQDDGIGAPPGVELVRPNSLGMQIIKILTRQLKGTFEVASGRPATFKISFPEAESGRQQTVQSAGGGR